MEIEVDGCPIHVRVTAGTTGPPLVLVHGGGGHTHWWDLVLDRLGDRRVLTMDLSGHGDSGRRDAYPPGAWADEIGAVAAVAGPGAVVVGHSMGGRMALLAAARHPAEIAAVIVVDSAVPLHPDERLPTVRARREYLDRAAAEAAFHLLPRQPEVPGVVAELATHSVTDRDGVWTFKFDPAVYGELLDQAPEAALGDVACPVVLISGAHSEITSAKASAELMARLGRSVPALELPGAHHHVPLDAPDELAALLRWLPETRAR